MIDFQKIGPLVEKEILSQGWTPPAIVTTPPPPPPPPPVETIPPPAGSPRMVITKPAEIQRMTLKNGIYESDPGVPDTESAVLHFDLSSANLKPGSRVVAEFERAIKIPFNVDPATVHENIKDYRAWPKPWGGATKNNIMFAQPYFGWFFVFVEYVEYADGKTHRWNQAAIPGDGFFRKEKFEFVHPSSLAAADGIIRRWLNGQLILEAKGVQFANASAPHNGTINWHCIQLHCPNWNPPADSFMKVKADSIRYSIY